MSVCGGFRFTGLSRLSPSCSLSLEVLCGPLVGLFNNKASLVCVYTKPLSVSPLLLCRSWLADNKHLSALTDQGIYGFIKVWFGDMLNSFPSGGAVFCSVNTSKPQVTITSLQHLGIVWQRWCSLNFVTKLFSAKWANICDALLPNQDFVSVSMCVVCLVPLEKTHGCVCAYPSVGHSRSSISSSGDKKASRFQQVEHTPTKKCVYWLYGGLCGPHTFSFSSQLNSNNRCIHTFT